MKQVNISIDEWFWPKFILIFHELYKSISLKWFNFIRKMLKGYRLSVMKNDIAGRVLTTSTIVARTEKKKPIKTILIGIYKI